MQKGRFWPKLLSAPARTHLMAVYPALFNWDKSGFEPILNREMSMLSWASCVFTLTFFVLFQHSADCVNIFTRITRTTSKLRAVLVSLFTNHPTFVGLIHMFMNVRKAGRLCLWWGVIQKKMFRNFLHCVQKPKIWSPIAPEKIDFFANFAVIFLTKYTQTWFGKLLFL